MRPDILNPLFAEVEVLKASGRQLPSRLKRLAPGAHRRHLFHSAVSWVERSGWSCWTRPMSARSSASFLTPVDYRHSGGRGRSGSNATDKAGNYVTLVYFSNPGLGEEAGFRLRSASRLRSDGDVRAGAVIIHPDHVLEPERVPELPVVEPSIRSRGLTEQSSWASLPPVADPGAGAWRMDRAEACSRAVAGLLEGRAPPRAPRRFRRQGAGEAGL
jgi:ATP-dependent DNA helicase RecG